MYFSVDKVSYQDSQEKEEIANEAVVLERCDAITDVCTLTEAIESTSVDAACRS